MESQAESQKKDNVIWTDAMDRAMLEAFKEQALIGNKAKGGLKTMRRMMKNVQELLKVSGFGWSDEKKMIVAETSVWNEYIEARPKMKYLKNKSLDLYLVMIEVLGEESAVGEKETTTTLMAEDESATAGSNANSESYGVGVNYVAGDQEGLGDLGQSSSSGKRNNDYTSDPPSKRNRSVVSSLAAEMGGIKFEIGRIATAMTERNDSHWKAVKESLDELDLETDCKF